MEWQPIETAPKDGTVFLSWVHDHPQFVAWVNARPHPGFRVLMPPGRGYGFGIHGNFAPVEPRYWVPLTIPSETAKQACE